MLSESQKISGMQDALHRSIFHWRTGSPSHCLLRIFGNPSSKQVVVVISSLASNQSSPENIMLDLLAVVCSILEEYEHDLGSNPSEVTWLLHFGDFSEPRSYATLQLPDEFDMPKFEWCDNQPIEELNHAALTSEDIRGMFPWLNLQPVETELDSLQTLR